MSRQQNWQIRRDTPKSSKGSRLGYGIFLLLLSAAGIGTFVYLQYPIAPRLFVRSFHFDDYGPFDIQARYTDRDIAGLARLFADPAEATAAKSEDASARFYDRVFQSHTDLQPENFQPQMLLNDIQEHDSALIYLAAHGVADPAGKTPYLLTGDDSSDPKQQLEPLLQTIAEIGSGQKLVLLDAGQVHADLPQGIVTNSFPLALHNVMKKQITDINLWVICSHGFFQNSQICENGAGSFFGKAVMDAISEFKGREDPSINVRDLYLEIYRRCVSYTLVNRENAQTPLLLRGGHGIVFKRDDDSMEFPGEMILASQINTINETDNQPGSKDSSEVAAQPATSDDASDSAADGQAGTSEDLPVETSAENLEASRLAGLWKLRDELQGRQYVFSPVDFAPGIWYGINERLIILERQRRRGLDMPIVALISDQETARLEELANAMKNQRDAVLDGNQSSNEFERLASAWNKFRADNDAIFDDVEGAPIAGIVDYTLAYRDLAFRSRYYAEWFERASMFDDLDLKEDIEKLLSAIGEYRPLFSTTQFRELESVLSTFAEERKKAIEDLNRIEQSMLRVWHAELKRIQSKDSWDFSAEYFLAGLLESPLLGLTSFFGIPPTQDDAKLLSRTNVDGHFQKMSALSPPTGQQLTSISWPTAPWYEDHAVSPLRHKITNQARLDILRLYFNIVDQHLPSVAISDLPSNLDSRWEDNETRLLLEMLNGTNDNSGDDENNSGENGFGAIIKRSLDEIALRVPHNWFDAIVLSRPQLRRINLQLKDGDFVASTFRFEIQAEEIVVEAIRRSENTGNIIDFDKSETLTQIIEIISAGDKTDKNVKLILKFVPTELADAISVKLNEQRLDAHEPFDISLQEKVFKLNFGLAEGAEALIPGFSQTGELKPEIFLLIADAEIQDRDIRIDDPLQTVDFGVRFGDANKVSLVIRTEDEAPDLQVAQSDTLSNANGILELKPFANRNRSFQFGLENHSARRKSVTLELYPVIIPADIQSETEPGVIPTGADQQIHPAVKALTLQRAKSGQQKFAISNSSVELDARQRKFIKLIPSPASLALEPADKDQLPAQTNSIDQQPAAAAIALNNGFLCRTIEKDVDFGADELIRDFWIQLDLFDTSSLFNQTAEFDPTDNPPRLKINLALKQANFAIAENFRVLIQSNLPASESEPLAIINPPKGIELNNQIREGSLSVDFFPQAFQRSDPIRLFVNINGESGVFVYELDVNNLGHRQQLIDDIRPQQSVFDFIKAIPNPLDPKSAVIFPNSKFIDLLPPENIAFSFLASLNDEQASDSRLVVEFGEADNIPFRLAKRGSHQLSFQLSAINELTGTLDLSAGVADHDFVFDGGTMEWLMKASIDDGRNQRQTALQKFRFDNVAPTGQLDFGKGNKTTSLTVGQTAAVRVQGTDNLTGIARIELFVDADNNGRFNDGDPLIDSRRNQDTAEFQLVTGKMVDDGLLKLGTNVLFAKLNDPVGNQTPDDNPVGPIELDLNARPIPAGAAGGTKKKRTEFTVHVRVVWKSALDQPEDLPGNRINNVILKSIDDKKGKLYTSSSPPKKNVYRFEKIPNGKYLVSGSGTSTGRPNRDIRGHLEFEVKDADIQEVVLPLEIGGKLEPDQKPEPEAASK